MQSKNKTTEKKERLRYLAEVQFYLNLEDDAWITEFCREFAIPWEMFLGVAINQFTRQVSPTAGYNRPNVAEYIRKMSRELKCLKT